MGATASALNMATVRPFSREPGTCLRKSRARRVSLIASSTNNVMRPAMLMSSIHGSHRSNSAAFCTAAPSRYSATNHSTTPMLPSTVVPYLRVRAAMSTYTSRFHDAIR